MKLPVMDPTGWKLLIDNSGSILRTDFSYSFTLLASRLADECDLITLILFSTCDSIALSSWIFEAFFPSSKISLIFSFTYKLCWFFKNILCVDSNGFASTELSDFFNFLPLTFLLSTFRWFLRHDDSSCLYKYDLRAKLFPHRLQ